MQDWVPLETFLAITSQGFSMGGFQETMIQAATKDNGAHISQLEKYHDDKNRGRTGIFVHVAVYLKVDLSS